MQLGRGGGAREALQGVRGAGHTGVLGLRAS